ncbi:hypothetical protein TNIN_179081 [Trichonephila inaurata madagascariensis]|uniref:Uncharacterized protein n=1 Tax=Trichonephila inaurata madagascariensis TaxID=2747483 RepID=A0A8X6XA56_9ARAC|nr:hypothetical protein TNIN_179081 [Trichonephila inaurata madagascariensis]
MATFIQGHLPSFLQITAYVLAIEILKISFTWDLGKNVAHTEIQILQFQKPNVQMKEIPKVYSIMVSKICEGLDIEVQLAPIEEGKIWISKFNNQRKRMKYIPTVQSEIVYKLCGALNLEVQLSAANDQKIFIQKQKKEQNKRRKSKKVIPIVKSPSIYKFCIALGIEARLDAESPI